MTNAAETRCLLRRIRTQSGESWSRSAGKNRRGVNVDLVDQALIQCMAKNVASALDEHTGDLARSQFPKQSGQPGLAIHLRRSRETIGKNARGPRQLSG